MSSTLGAPGLARLGIGQAASDSPTVRPIRPGNVVPGWDSVNAISARSSTCLHPFLPAAVNRPQNQIPEDQFQARALSADRKLSGITARFPKGESFYFTSGCLVQVVCR